MAAEREGGWVLVVDDETDVRDIVCLILDDHGVPAIGASDGIEALEVLRDHPAPSLVVLDLMMPRMDGWQFRAAQLADPRLAGIPVLVISGDGKVSAKASSLRAVGHLRKPVELEELLRAVDRHRGDPTKHPAPPPR